MAKRFTDTDKYKKPFLRGLQGAYKLLWDYICNDCNHAGIWIVDFEVAQIYLGRDMEINREEALRVFNAGKTRVIEFEKGSRWFIVSFIEFQYGVLNPQNRAHLSIISCLRLTELWKIHNDTIKPLISPLQGAMDMDKDMDKENKGVKGGKSHKSKSLDMSIVPKEHMEAIQKWIGYKIERGEKYTPAGFAQMVKKLIRFSDNDPITASQIIEDAMGNNYAGFFKPEIKHNNGTTNNRRVSKTVIPTNTGGYSDSL